MVGGETAALSRVKYLTSLWSYQPGKEKWDETLMGMQKSRCGMVLATKKDFIKNLYLDLFSKTNVFFVSSCDLNCCS